MTASSVTKDEAISQSILWYQSIYSKATAQFISIFRYCGNINSTENRIVWTRYCLEWYGNILSTLFSK